MEWSKLPHSKLLLNKELPPQKFGCEACHGPASEHIASGDVAAIRNPRKMKPADRDTACLNCHETKISKMGWRQTPHYQTGMACYDCHDPHKSTQPKLLVKPQKELCAKCHQDVQAKFNMLSHHPLNEGRITCVNCHDVHDGKNPLMGNTNTSQDRLCLKCHADKAGPFVFEHEAISQSFGDACAECHQPHGSPNEKLLIVNGRGLCLRCHGADYLNHKGGVIVCYNCHRAIHGSMTDEFMRR